MGSQTLRTSINPEELLEIALLFYEGFDTKDIADELEVRESTIANALPRALEFLRERLCDHGLPWAKCAVCGTQRSP